MPVIIPILLLGAGVAALAILAIARDDSPVPNNPPDLPPMPGSTRYKFVDKILPQLQQAAASSGVPLGLLVGWVAKESGGKLAVHPQPGPGDTKLDERGYFQLSPDESKRLGLDHQRLSVDPVYSINGGLALVASYVPDADALGVAQRGSSYFWMLDKLMHTVGPVAARKWVGAAKDEGVAGSWESFSRYATAHDSDLLHMTKHSPLKWIPFVEEVYSVGAPFGFGSGAITMVGAAGSAAKGTVFSDIPDPLDCL